VDGRVRGRVKAVTSSVPLIPLAAAVHGMSAPTASGLPVTVARSGHDLPGMLPQPTDRRAHQWAITQVARDLGALRAPRHAPIDMHAQPPGVAQPDLVNLTLVEDHGLVNFNALPAETPAAMRDGSPEPTAGPATFPQPIKPVTAPATAITQGASIPVGSIPGPTAGTASTSAWWSSSASPRSA
jgi:hypothetical protein